MRGEDIEKTPFVCEFGLFEWTRMPFGMSNAPPQFQRIMNRILSEFVGKFIFVYMDNTIIFSRTPEEHAKHIGMIFTRLEEYGLTLKPNKCHFCKEEVELLGFVVNKDGIKPQVKKVEVIKNMLPPTTVKQVRSFLGMTGFYRRCIPNFAETSEPLVDLARKNTRFKWGQDHQIAFEKLKQALITYPILAYPNTRKPYKLYTDACDYPVGEILVQEDDEGMERVIHFLSHQLNAQQRTWATMEKEAYAIVYALNKLKTYLWGAQFTIYTDHKPLKSLFIQEVQNTKVQRWAVLISEFGAPIQYQKESYR